MEQNVRVKMRDNKPCLVCGDGQSIQEHTIHVCKFSPTVIEVEETK